MEGMELGRIWIATITLARSVQEERELKKALTVLSRLGVGVVVADGGSPPGFIEFLKELKFMVRRPKRKGLVPQVKTSLQAAVQECGGEFILYTEPDKLPFFEGGLKRFVQRARLGGNFEMALPVRDEKSFRTFSRYQQKTEKAMNEFTELILGRKGDYCYGPLLMTAQCAKMVRNAPEDIGWGWRFFLFAEMHKRGSSMQNVRGYYPCPMNQRRESKADRIYRIKQLRQNLDGIFRGLEARV